MGLPGLRMVSLSRSGLKGIWAIWRFLSPSNIAQGVQCSAASLSPRSITGECFLFLPLLRSRHLANSAKFRQSLGSCRQLVIRAFWFKALFSYFHFDNDSHSYCNWFSIAPCHLLQLILSCRLPGAVASIWSQVSRKNHAIVPVFFLSTLRLSMRLFCYIYFVGEIRRLICF